MRFVLDVYHHYEEGGHERGNVHRKLDTILQNQQSALVLIEALKEMIMTQFETLKALTQGLKDHTNVLSQQATVISGNVEKIVTMLEVMKDSPTPEKLQEVIDELSTVNTDLGAHSEHLKAIGDRSDDPLPTPPPEPEPLPEPNPELAARRAAARKAGQTPPRR